MNAPCWIKCSRRFARLTMTRRPRRTSRRLLTWSDLISGLTRKVVGALKPDERTVLDQVLKAVRSAYDDKTATPNIEEIADLVRSDQRLDPKGCGRAQAG